MLAHSCCSGQMVVQSRRMYLHVSTCCVCLGSRFRVNEDSVRHDHRFLDDDALEALFRSVLLCLHTLFQKKNNT